jgi:hypothetical protein
MGDVTPDPLPLPPNLLSMPDADGRRSARWDFPVTLVKGGDEKLVYTSVIPLDCTGFTHVTEVSTFIGLSRGDIVEAAASVYATGGYDLYERSFHKEIPGDYEAWDHQPVTYHLGDPLVLSLILRVTGRDPEGSLSATVQFALWLKVR